MNDETKNKIAAQVAEIHFAENLPAEIDGFTLKKIFAPVEDKFIFFTYADEKIHCGLTTYYHRMMRWLFARLRRPRRLSSLTIKIITTFLKPRCGADFFE